MEILIDSGVLYALLDTSDEHHQSVLEAFSKVSNESLVLPTVVLTEVTHLLSRRLGYHEMRQFILYLKSAPWRFECIQQEDLTRIFELLDQYADLKLDFVDATIVTLAERLDIRTILTVDHKDFHIIRPKHCEYFNILP